MVNTSILLGVALATLINVVAVTASKKPSSLDTTVWTANDTNLIPEEEFDFDQGSLIAERKKCLATRQCTNAGGSCIKSRANCDGTVNPQGCKGKKCKCCIPNQTTTTTTCPSYPMIPECTTTTTTCPSCPTIPECTTNPECPTIPDQTTTTTTCPSITCPSCPTIPDQTTTTTTCPSITCPSCPTIPDQTTTTTTCPSCPTIPECTTIPECPTIPVTTTTTTPTTTVASTTRAPTTTTIPVTTTTTTPTTTVTSTTRATTTTTIPVTTTTTTPTTTVASTTRATTTTTIPVPAGFEVFHERVIRRTISSDGRSYNWDTAMDFCNQFRAKPFIPRTVADYALYKTVRAALSSSYSMWLPANDRDQEGTLRWYNGELDTNISLWNWYNGQDLYNNAESNDCLVYHTNGAYMSYCSYKRYPPICEMI